MFIEGSGGALLLDAGLSAKETILRCERAGKQPEDIQAILLTHEHDDHCAGAGALARRLNVPVYATRGTLHEFPANRRKTERETDTRPCVYGEPFCIGSFMIEPFATSHDAREPCGFCIGVAGIKLGCCTDTGVVTPAMMSVLRKCDGLVLESNHCPVMLDNGPYPESLKRRIRSARGHLSNRDAAQCLRQLKRDLSALVLAHLSEVNNTTEKARMGAREGLGLLYDQTPLVIATQGGTSAACPQVLRL
jgi:phosphoribosyl 1,2-cyclic phosphodiesterase